MGNCFESNENKDTLYRFCGVLLTQSSGQQQQRPGSDKKQSLEIVTSASTLRNQEKGIKSNVNSAVEIIKIKVEINKREHRQNQRKINEIKCWFFEVNKIGNLQTDQSGKKKKKSYKLLISGVREVTSLQILQILRDKH